MRASRLVAPLAWTAVIAWFSTDMWSGEHTASLVGPWLRALLPAAGPDAIASAHWIVRKLAHMVEYGILAVLWMWALGDGRSRAARNWALGLSLATAALDELHQATTQSRGGSPVDLLIDGIGAALALALARGGVAAALEALAAGLLWTAAAGGSLLLALATAAGAPGGWLWVTTPAAWVALWWRHRQLTATSRALRP
jgi:VanZ family protein